MRTTDPTLPKEHDDAHHLTTRCGLHPGHLARRLVELPDIRPGRARPIDATRPERVDGDDRGGGGGPDCEPGWVDPIILSTKADADAPHPITTRDGSRVIGAWVNGLGWLPTDVVQSKAFDVDTWLAAERSLSAPVPGPAAD